MLAVTPVAFPCQSRTASLPGPVALARAWQAQASGVVWLDSATSDEDSISVLAKNPREILQGHIHRDAEALRLALRHGARESSAGGLLGWVGFDGRFTFGHYDSCAIWQDRTASWKLPHQES